MPSDLSIEGMLASLLHYYILSLYVCHLATVIIVAVLLGWLMTLVVGKTVVIM